MRLKEQFEVAQKEQQIILLETENALKEKQKQTQIVLRNIAFVLIVVVIMLGFLIFNRIRIKQQIKQLEIRNSIASDLHDDIGSTLSSIKMYSDIVTGQIKNNNPESIPLLHQMSNNSKEMIENMSDIVWAIKPANDAFKNIESRMFNFATELCIAAGIELVFHRNNNLEDLKIPMDQRRDLYLVFKEGVINAIKYSDCNKLEISFLKTGSWFTMQISDNGKGFNAEELLENDNLLGGNGLKNMKQRAISNNGTLKIETELGFGSKLVFKMPIP